MKKSIITLFSVCLILTGISGFSQMSATIAFIKVEKEHREDYETILKDYLIPIFDENVKQGNIIFGMRGKSFQSILEVPSNHKTGFIMLL